MLNTVLVILLLLLCVLICGLFGLAGFFIGHRSFVLKREKPPEMTEKEINERKKQENDLKSFLEYTGYEHND